MTWCRTTRSNPCPVCGKPDWCLLSTEGDAAICARIESDRHMGEAGWFHRLDAPVPLPSRRIAKAERHPAAWWENFTASCEHEGAQRLPGLARKLGLTLKSLRRLNTGWSAEHRGWTFPMRNAAGRVVGIRLRMADGRKLSVRGGHEGLFIPAALPEHLTTLFVCEGPTDTGAALDLGLQAIGRPSCTGGVRHIVELVRMRRPAQVVVVADRDAPGQRGAKALAGVLLAYSHTIKVVTPPPPAKDLRCWLNQGGNIMERAHG